MNGTGCLEKRRSYSGHITFMRKRKLCNYLPDLWDFVTLFHKKNEVPKVAVLKPDHVTSGEPSYIPKSLGVNKAKKGKKSDRCTNLYNVAMHYKSNFRDLMILMNTFIRFQSITKYCKY